MKYNHNALKYKDFLYIKKIFSCFPRALCYLEYFLKEISSDISNEQI